MLGNVRFFLFCVQLFTEECVIMFFSNAMLLPAEQVVPQLSCPIALFSYYNPILKRGIQKFMSTIKDVGVHGM